jgi:uncharacterized protein (DUF1499 family)
MKTSLKSIMICSCIFLLGCNTGKASNMTVQGPSEKISLEPCPKTPNCVSSMMPIDSKRYIAPLRYTGKKELAYQKLVIMIESNTRALIITRKANYIKAEFKSAIFGFVDDVEFLVSSDQSIIEVRSASRVGYYDLGKNRRRIEDIRKKWDNGMNH